MGANGPVRRGEYDEYRRAADRRLDRLEAWQDSHVRDHDEDDDDQAERRRWSWQQIVAWAAVAAVLVGAWMTAAASTTAK